MANPAAAIAEKLLRDHGFNEKDANVILTAARKNSWNPITAAWHAIRFRKHVQAGAPL